MPELGLCAGARITKRRQQGCRDLVPCQSCRTVSMHCKGRTQPSPPITRQTSAAVLDAETGDSTQYTSARERQSPLKYTRYAASELAPLWLAGFAAASAVIPSLTQWRSALRLGLGLFLFSILQANFHGEGTDPIGGVYRWIIPGYFVSDEPSHSECLS